MDVRSDTVDLISYIKGCDVLKSGCDDKNTVGAMSDTGGVISCLKWM